MNEFVQDCRREWKRLGVADHLADEMMAELAADLAEAESEGASAEDVLGSPITDPRSFAASWARERGLVHPRRTARSLRSRPLALAAFVTLGFLAVIGAAAVIFASDTGQRGSLRLVVPPPSAQPVTVTPDLLTAPPPDTGDSLDSVAWVLLAVGVIGVILSSFLWTAWARARPPVALG